MIIITRAGKGKHTADICLFKFEGVDTQGILLKLKEQGWELRLLANGQPITDLQLLK